MKRFLLLLLASASILVACNEAVTYISVTRELPEAKEVQAPVPDEELIAAVDYQSSGCFSGETGHLQLKRIGNAVFAELKMNDTSKIVVELNEQQLIKFNTFIKELKLLNGLGFSTVTSQYTVFYKGEKIRKMDAGVRWAGFNGLKTALFYSK